MCPKTHECVPKNNNVSQRPKNLSQKTITCPNGPKTCPKKQESVPIEQKPVPIVSQRPETVSQRRKKVSRFPFLWDSRAWYTGPKRCPGFLRISPRLTTATTQPLTASISVPINNKSVPGQTRCLLPQHGEDGSGVVRYGSGIVP